MKFNLIKRSILLFFTAVLLLTLLTGCKKASGSVSEPVSTGEIGVIHDEEFGNVYIDMTIPEFNNRGFEFGDSVDITFSNGKSYTDIPYYSGYYCPIGELLLCGYPGYPYVKIARNYGEPTWEEFELTDSDKVTVTLNEKGKNLPVQELLSLKYSNNREDFASDIIFANFREVYGGKIRKHTFYRSASPCNNQYKRAATASALAEKFGIRYVLNLSDDEESYNSYLQNPEQDLTYYDSLYREGNVILLAMTANFHSDRFIKSISRGLLSMTEHDGPVLVHCVEGKDRTGIACALMLALADANPLEIIEDYMVTYDNYYGVNAENDLMRYMAIQVNITDFLYYICDAEDSISIEKLDLKAGGESYLRKGGLSDDQIKKIENYLTQ